MKGLISLVIIVILISGCKSLSYKDPDSDEILTYSSFFTSATDVQVLFASPEKVISVSIGSTQNDQVIEQASDLIKAQNRGDDK